MKYITTHKNSGFSQTSHIWLKLCYKIKIFIPNIKLTTKHWLLENYLSQILSIQNRKIVEWQKHILRTSTVLEFKLSGGIWIQIFYLINIHCYLEKECMCNGLKGIFCMGILSLGLINVLKHAGSMYSSVQLVIQLLLPLNFISLNILITLFYFFGIPSLGVPFILAFL